MWSGKLMTINSCINEKRCSINISYKTSEYFPKSYWCSGANIKVKSDLSNYAT